MDSSSNFERAADPPAFWPSPQHLDSQSQSRNNLNLRQATAALDTAYERITSLRNSINNMLNRIPPDGAATGLSTSGGTDTQPRHSLSHDPNIRPPPHSALVLSDEQVVEELNLRAARLRTLISPSARQRLEEFESNSRSHTRRELAWDGFSRTESPRPDRSDTRPVPTQLRSPPMPDLILPGSRSLQSAHRDDSSTMIGRRVAARVNATDSGQSSISSRLSLSQIEQRLQAQTAQVARELENMTERLAAQRSRRVELASSRARGDRTGTTAATESQTSTLSNTSGDVRSFSNPPVSRQAREVTLVDNITRIVLPQPISRTSSDGTPLDELSAPARRSLSAAFREHIATHRDHAQAGDTFQDSPRNLANAPEVRGTLVNLLARDREEQIPAARRSEYTRLGVETSRSRRDDTFVRSDPLSPAGVGQGRRRSRLNPDGDEIDSDEDDNVSPPPRRPRIDQPATRSHTVTIEDILWRTSGSDSEADAVSISLDGTESCQPLFQSSPSQPAVRHPHPLPTPVEDMLIYPAAIKAPQPPRVICVSKYASLAGR